MDPVAPSVTRHAHASTRLFVHLVWSTRRRVPWLDPRLDEWLAGLLERKAKRLECDLLGVGNAADHVHAVVRYPPRVAVAEIAQRLKGASSFELNRELGFEGPVWQIGYWAESVAPTDLEALVRYVRTQRLRHGERPTAEPWEAVLR
jgi:putative transposase